MKKQDLSVRLDLAKTCGRLTEAVLICSYLRYFSFIGSFSSVTSLRRSNTIVLSPECSGLLLLSSGFILACTGSDELLSFLHKVDTEPKSQNLTRGISLLRSDGKASHRLEMDVQDIHLA